MAEDELQEYLRPAGATDVRRPRRQGPLRRIDQRADDLLRAAVHRRRIDDASTAGEELPQDFAQRLPRLIGFADVESAVRPHADHGELLPGPRDRPRAHELQFSSGSLICARRRRNQSGGRGEQNVAARPAHRAVSSASSLRARKRLFHSHTPESATATAEMGTIPSPSACSAEEVQAAIASPPRYTTVSMKFLDLYFCSRGTSMKRISRAGRSIAKCAARRMPCTMAIMKKVGSAASATKPPIVSTGRRARPARMPARRRNRPVMNPWMSSVSTFTTRSMRANKAVRTRGSVLARETICACSRYGKVAVAVSSSTYAQIRSRNRDWKTTRIPLMKLPPSGCSATCSRRSSPRSAKDQRCSAPTHCTLASSSTAETSSRCVVPSGLTRNVVRSGPANAPALPPAAMNP